MAFNHLTPMLEVENMDETIDFYQTILDFTCQSRLKNEWALVKKDDVVIMFSSRFYKKEFQNTYMTGSLYINTDDVDVLWLILKDKVKICYPIENFSHGMREFCIYDNNRYRIQFGQELDTN
jgi:uncharacterized glyoxalase superfamily protein PhnB